MFIERDCNLPKEEIERVAARAEAIAAKLGEHWSLWLSRASWRNLNFVFDWDHDNVPTVDPVDRYLTEHYDCLPGSVPGFVKCEGVEEADHFLDLVEKWHKEHGSEPIDYTVVTKAYASVMYDAHANAASTWSDEWDPKSLPCEFDGIPYWWDDAASRWRDAEMVTTAGWSNIYGSWHDIPDPKECVGLFVDAFGDTGGEQEVELDLDFWERNEIEPGSIQAFLLLQLLCARKNTWSEHCYHAFVRTDTIGGLWLKACPENIPHLHKAFASEHFRQSYSSYVSWGKERSEAEEAVSEWCEAAGLDLAVAAPFVARLDCWRKGDAAEMKMALQKWCREQHFKACDAETSRQLRGHERKWIVYSQKLNQAWIVLGETAGQAKSHIVEDIEDCYEDGREEGWKDVLVRVHNYRNYCALVHADGSGYEPEVNADSVYDLRWA